MSDRIQEFKYACEAYLLTLSLGELRNVGRMYGVSSPTKPDKKELTALIIAVLTGELQPKAPSKRGAPVKNPNVRMEIKTKINGLLASYFPEQQVVDESFLEEYTRNIAKVKENPVVLTLESSTPVNVMQYEENLYIGQMEKFGDVFVVLPLDCSVQQAPLIMPPALISEYDLRVGDIVSCKVRKTQNALVVDKITCVNDLAVGTYNRFHFEEDTVITPNRRLALFDNAKKASVTAKYLSWLTPVYKGQRLCVASEPKAGKSELLYELVQSLRSCDRKPYILVYLCAQSAENIVRYRNMLHDGVELVYSTYEDEPERQVFMADFLLRRAKRLTEMRNDVVLIIDSFTALARAYNDTEESSGGKMLAGGLESKTLLYLKRYFSAGRAFANEASLTVIGSVSTNTGNPADEIICADLLSVANAQIRLSAELSRKRMYPPIDIENITNTHEGEGTEKTLKVVREKFLAGRGEEALRKLLDKAKDEAEFVGKIMCK